MRLPLTSARVAPGRVARSLLLGARAPTDRLRLVSRGLRGAIFWASLARSRRNDEGAAMTENDDRFAQLEAEIARLRAEQDRLRAKVDPPKPTKSEPWPKYDPTENFSMPASAV